MQSFNPRALACSLRASRGMNVKIVVYRGVIGNVGVWSPESWITFLHPRVDRIMCVSDAVKRYFLNIRFLGRRIPPHKIVRIYKGHNLEWYTKPPADISSSGSPITHSYSVAQVAIGRVRVLVLLLSPWSIWRTTLRSTSCSLVICWEMRSWAQESEAPGMRIVFG